jgi:hypothetical protein
MTPAIDLKEAAAAYESASQYFLNLARGITPDLLDVHAENEWSARQCIHHMADSEAQSYARLRRLVAEPEGSIIQGYDEAAWANEPKLAYADGAVENAIAVYAAVRASSLDLVKRLTEEDLEKFGEHTESGKYTIARWLESYTKHPYDHGDQMVRATKGQA